MCISDTYYSSHKFFLWDVLTNSKYNIKIYQHLHHPVLLHKNGAIKLTMKIIKNINDLNRLLEQRACLALKQTQKIVYECIQESINEYYSEKVFRGGTSNQPLLYSRSYKLLNSLVKTNIVKYGNSISCEVKIDEDYLRYQYPGTDGIDGISATGLDVLTWNEENGSHGGTVDGDVRIWSDAMKALGGEYGIIAILKTKLKKSGIKIE